jgi:hypothetical protein
MAVMRYRRQRDRDPIAGSFEPPSRHCHLSHNAGVALAQPHDRILQFRIVESRRVDLGEQLSQVVLAGIRHPHLSGDFAQHSFGGVIEFGDFSRRRRIAVPIHLQLQVRLLHGQIDMLPRQKRRLRESRRYPLTTPRMVHFSSGLGVCAVSIPARNRTDPVT